MKYRISYWSYDELQSLLIELIEKSNYYEKLITLLSLFSANSDNSLPFQFTNQIIAFLINLMLTLKKTYHLWNKNIEDLLLNQICEYLTLNLQSNQIDILYHKTGETSKIYKIILDMNFLKKT